VSHALLLATIPVADLQNKARAEILKGEHGEPMPFRWCRNTCATTSCCA
jgi:hypothetical protein